MYLTNYKSIKVSIKLLDLHDWFKIAYFYVFYKQAEVSVNYTKRTLKTVI